MNVTINVTAADIAAAPPPGQGNAADCPLAQAFRRLFPHLTRPLVFVYHLLPGTAARNIARYDSGDQIEPFSFDMELPDDLAARMVPAGS